MSETLTFGINGKSAATTDREQHPLATGGEWRILEDARGCRLVTSGDWADDPPTVLTLALLTAGGMAAANARLIAAAPDLLAACEALLRAVEGHERRTGVTQMHSSIDTARAAIARATGE